MRSFCYLQVLKKRGNLLLLVSFRSLSPSLTRLLRSFSPALAISTGAAGGQDPIMTRVSILCRTSLKMI